MSHTWECALRKTYYKFRNTGTRNYGTRNTDGTAEHWRNTGTQAQAERRKTDGAIEIPQNSGTGEYQRNNGTTKQHQEILPIQNDDILSRQHKKVERLHKCSNILKLKLSSEKEDGVFFFILFIIFNHVIWSLRALVYISPSCKVSFYCTSVEVYQIILKLRCWPLVFIFYKAF